MDKSEGPAPFWYVLETKLGDAPKVADALKAALARLGLDQRVLEIKTPEQPAGSTTAAPIAGELPGFFVVRMRFNPTDWQKVRGFPGVTGALGERSTPTPLTDRELGPVCRHMLEPRRRRVVRFSGSGGE